MSKDKTTRREFLRSVLATGALACSSLTADPLLAATKAAVKEERVPVKAGLFSAATLNGMQLSNRLVRSATWTGLAAPDGAVSEALTARLVELARGGTGLIITGYSFVRRDGQSRPNQLAAYDDRFIPGLTSLVDAVHAAGGKIAQQLVHGGIYSDEKVTGMEPIGPSVFTKDGQALCRAMTHEEITAITVAFTRAAARAKIARFDAVEIHGSHGFLLSQFLSPYFNKREDEFGGALENRARFLLDTVKAVRNAVGPGYPVLVKLNSEDYVEGGFSREEAVAVSVMLQKAGVDAIEFSGGTAASPKDHSPSRPGDLQGPDKEVYYRAAAKAYKQKVTIPLLLVGGIRSSDVANGLVQDGTADFVSMARPLIREPDLANRWRSGDTHRAACISCNGCSRQAAAGKGAYCVFVNRNRTEAGKA